MKEKEVKLDIETSHTLGGSVEGVSRGEGNGKGACYSDRQIHYSHMVGQNQSRDPP